MFIFWLTALGRFYIDIFAMEKWEIRFGPLPNTPNVKGNKIFLAILW